jgi:hypothetical protein
MRQGVVVEIDELQACCWNENGERESLR